MSQTQRTHVSLWKMDISEMEMGLGVTVHGVVVGSISPVKVSKQE